MADRFCLGPRLQQRRSRHAQRLRQLFEDKHRRVPHPPLDAADIGPVQAGLEGQLFLGPAPLPSDPLAPLTRPQSQGLPKRPSRT